MHIHFRNLTKEDIALYYIWCEKPHVKEKWFREGYEPKEKILQKIDGKNGTFPFIIEIENKPVGYIQYYKIDGTSDSVGFDIFIGEEDYVGKGYGSKVVEAFTHKLFALSDINRVIVDPFADDKRAIRCYEKAGFAYLRTDKDDTGSSIYIMIKDK